MDVQLLLYRPTEYFRHFERRSTSLFVALGVFFLLAVVEAAGAGGIPTRSEVCGAVLGVLLNWLLNTFLFGVLWFFLGARFLGGRATLGTTVRAVGYAFLYYVLSMRLGKELVAIGAVGPFVSAWATNLVYLGAGLILMRRVLVR